MSQAKLVSDVPQGRFAVEVPMRVATRAAAVPVFIGLFTAALGQEAPASGRNPIPAIRADQWSAAADDVGGYADPITAKLVLYYRLLAPGAATPQEIATFMQENPHWPNQALLEHHRETAMAADPDDADVLGQCAIRRPLEGLTLLRCAAALANAGRNEEALADARQAWITGVADPAQENAFLLRWGSEMTPDDQWARFQELAWNNPAAAGRQIARLDPSRQKQAEARLAFQRKNPGAEALLAEAHAAETQDPGLMLDHARFLRRTGRAAEAYGLWRRDGEAAEDVTRATAPANLPAFGKERNQLARTLLADGNAKDAYSLLQANDQSAAEVSADSEFLAGFIALRKLKDPATALHHFAKLAEFSKAAISQARAWYWQGRAKAAMGQDPLPSYRNAAAWPTTFYGQLGALTLGDDVGGLTRRITALRDPAWTREAALAFIGGEVVRAAAWLVAWDDPRRARSFLLGNDAIAPDAADRALTAQLSLRVELPEIAVFIARRMGRDGLALPEAGWPAPFDPPSDELDPAVVLGIMRQESSFDVAAVSPSGARGLMQLMPSTADKTAKQLGVTTSVLSLTSDPEHNMRLGTAYLLRMLQRFGGSLPLAIAAYNAGPDRVDQWLSQNGDPRQGPIDMIDWIEQIPFGETRNYVQRVLENVTIYRARRGETTPTLLAQWTQ